MVSRLNETKNSERFLGETDYLDILNSLSWSNLVVSRLYVDKTIEEGNAEQINRAEDALQVQFIAN